MVMLAGDHIYKMDYEQMLQQHVEPGADVTVGCIEVPLRRRPTRLRRHARRRGTTASLAFLEKPAEPPPMPGKPDMALASMGIYVFETKFLIEELRATPPIRIPATISARTSFPTSSQDGKAVAHHFSQLLRASARGAGAYWRDVGTVDAYWEANIDLTDIVPDLDLYDRDWPIWTYGRDHAAGQVRPRRRRPARHGDLLAGFRRLHHLGRRDFAVAAVHRRARALLFDRPRDGRCCPMCRSAATRGFEKR